MNIQEKIIFLLDNECSHDGVKYFAEFLWDDRLNEHDNLILYNYWWTTESENYL